MAESKIIKLQPGESVTIVCESEAVQTTPATPISGGGINTDERMTFGELLAEFNEVLAWRGYKGVTQGMAVYDYLSWACDFARRQYDGDVWMFLPSTYPLLYDYRGTDETDIDTGYNAMQSWLMASILAELVPDSGATTNTQTELFKLAYEIGGGKTYPLYNGKSLKADPYAMREAASVMYAICRGDGSIAGQIDTYRRELGGSPIPASNWDGLGYQNTMLTDSQGRRGYRMDYLGYAVNSELFLPDAPAPRVPATTVCELPWPWEQGQDISLFNQSTGNYLMDEVINNHFVANYNMMSQTPLSEWDSYPREKQNRLVNVGAIPPCTFIYMFSKIKVKFDGIIRKSYDGKITADYYCFSKTSDDTGLALDGPFSDLEGMYRYNTLGDREKCLEEVASIFDNFRFPTEDPNYGRCRPGCAVSRTVKSLNPVNGAPENEIYNVDLCVMVADNVEGAEKGKVQDGFAADSPRSYVSGHSAQIWGLALMLTQMNNEGNCDQWIRKAYEYSVNRSVGRFHWNSDCIYGRLFGSLALPIINAMNGLKSGLDTIRNYVLNPAPQPAPTGNWDAHIILRNQTGRQIQSTGEVRMYVAGHEGVNVYTPNVMSVGAAITIPAGGEYAYDTQCVGNGFTLDDSYDGKALEDARIYDERHWNNADWTPPATVSIDPAGSTVLRKSGATYILVIK